MNSLEQTFANKTVLITGHTGFKGSWLSLWLNQLGAKVHGLSLDIPTTPSMFEAANLSAIVDHRLGDVRDGALVQNVIEQVKPDFIFHLAAQAIVSLSYSDPLDTITTNAVGTANLLEACRNVPGERVVLAITSDKCYDNVEWEWGYKETDALGGKDIYSASKAAAEVVFHSYFKSFFDDPDCPTRLASARAGNVIGGGDWAQDRIVVDCVQSWNEGRPVPIRSPQATRPWQHVLEPLSGYLTLAASLAQSPKLSGESFNFGPKADQNRTVVELLSDLMDHWTGPRVERPYDIVDNIPFNEAGLLKLNCDKALFHLKWQPTLSYQSCVKMVGDWYSAFYKGGVDVKGLSLEQLAYYADQAREQDLIWTKA